MPNSRFDLSLVQLLRPLARILLRQGVTARQFSRWSDAAFVQAAADLLAEQGAESSFSRISTLTGLHRHSVSDLEATVLRRERREPDEKEYGRNRLARVLTGWFEDPSFTDRSGHPRLLPFDGPSPSFVELVRAYSGDIYPKIILDELLRVGAASVEGDGNVRAISRRYTSGGADPDAVRHATVVAADVLDTLEHNMSAPPEERRFEDASVSLDVDARSVKLLRRLLKRRGAAFLNDIEGWLNETERKSPEGAGPRQRVRAGVRVVMVVEPTVPDAGKDAATSTVKNRPGR